jgi:2-C-methyl-D-erythritol 2,4-cyclodiphosphate synthase
VSETRVGYGYDIHRLVPDRPLILGGVEIDSEVGLLGHSDGDAVLHALTDAILGAAGLGDIGEHFPDTSPEFAGASSDRFLNEARRLIALDGYTLVNADVTVIAERPRLGALKMKIRKSVAALLEVTPEHVAVKARTREGLGAVGRGEAIETHVVVLIERSRT